jgi:monoamine oxidase
MASSCDVVVIGAGAAGLAAARTISEAGHRVHVLEARTRIGGRILTVHDHEWPLPVELGPEFLHGEAEEARRIVDTAALGLVEIPDVHVWARAGRLSPQRDPWPRMVRVRRRFSTLRRDLPVAEALHRLRIAPAERRLARLFVEGYYAAPLDRASSVWLAASPEEEKASFRQYRLTGGYAGLVRWLADGLDPTRTELRLGTVAEEVAWSRGRVDVTVRRAFGEGAERVRGRAVVVTVPLGVLQAAPGERGALRFSPEPPRLARAVAALLSGNVCKLVLRFREAFWDEPDFFARRLGGRSGLDPTRIDFLHDERGSFPTWWTANPWRAPVLTAWAAGPRADALSGLDEPGLVARAVDGLSTMLGLKRGVVASLVQSWCVHDWRGDPYSRGAYSAVAVGGTTAQRALSRPHEGTLFFAGEATEPDETGTVSGALASGARAARQALEVLDRR